MTLEEGFEVNLRKVRMRGSGSSQRVTGLVVNEKVSLEREWKRALRAKVHNIVHYGPKLENLNNNPFFREEVLGEIGFAATVDPAFAGKLREKIRGVQWT